MILNDLLAMLPKPLVHHHGANGNFFWVSTLNSIMGEIDRMGLLPMQRQRIVIANPDEAAVLKPKTLKYLRQLSNDQFRDLDFEDMESQFVITDERWYPGVNDSLEMQTTASPLVSPGRIRAGGAQEDYNYSGWSFTVTNTTGLILTSGIIIAGEVDTVYGGQIVTLDTKLTPTLPDQVVIYMADRPLILEGTVRSGAITATSTIPLDDEWARLLVAGMRYYGEIQMDEASNTAKFWAGEYQRMLDDLRSYATRARGKVGRVKSHVNLRFGF